MAVPKGVTWKLEPHTKAKHEILRRYLQAWFPIMARRTKRRIVYVDGFSGPGEYTDGEEGSPVIAVNVARAALAYLPHVEAVFLFIDQDERRVAHLKGILHGMNLSGNISIRCECGEFDQRMAKLLDDIEERSARLAPTFAFIDPFGFRGMPLSIVQQIMSYPQCEVLVNFTYESINRWLTHEDQQDNLTALFGTEDYRNVPNDTPPRQRNELLRGLYRRRLLDPDGARAKYVRSFEMIDAGNRTEYFLFYATNHIRGLEKMKDAMWKVDESGGVSFSDATNLDQVVMFGSEPDYALLQRQIEGWCLGRKVSIEQLEEFVLAETAFKKSHIKGPILAPLERSGRLTVHESRRKRSNTYPRHTWFTILPQTDA